MYSLPTANGIAHADPVLTAITADGDARLIELLRGIGQLDTTCSLLRLLRAARPERVAVDEAYAEALIVKAAQVLERCYWATAERLLTPLTKVSVSQPAQAVLNPNVVEGE